MASLARWTALSVFQDIAEKHSRWIMGVKIENLNKAQGRTPTGRPNNCHATVSRGDVRGITNGLKIQINCCP